MPLKSWIPVLLAALVVGVVLAGFTAGWLLPGAGAAEGPVDPADHARNGLLDLELAFAKTVDDLQPSVVSIITSSHHGKAYVRELGSGVIIDVAGHILTCNHVIAKGKIHQVELHDGRKYRGQLVGADPLSDLAVLRINAPKLVPARLGDSDKARVGTWVLAMGTPHELAGTVTAGIISAKGRRRVRLVDYENYIQTDAAINLGNSGGPLVNLRGQVIAINTAVLSPKEGSQGIGFAIPINMARVVKQQLIDNGRVIRGWLGVNPGQLSRTTAQALLYKGGGGIIINEIIAGSPAENAGLQIDDIVIKLDGTPINDERAFRLAISQKAPRTRVLLDIWRNGKMMKRRIPLGDLKTFTKRRGG